ncbi:type VI secretion system protein TssA [Pseudoduganella lutea]|uniref:type VI secretion system protein TssA n=1 Tax=Pseudoduganella lutea TaxID=321985 RepID=UPI001E4092CB|nr:type VI secretion system protein TssA [Pseudoduganella lutea]
MFSAEQLLQPISADQPGGIDLSFSPELDAIAHARTFDDPSLDQGEWVTTLKEADWEFVVHRCAALLETSSKDLRVAAWLTEAAAKEHHLRGLTEGLRVLAGLFERFWDQGLYPEADDGDQERRIGTLSWLLGRIKPLLREMPITDGNGGPFTPIDFESARRQGGDDNRRLAELEAAKRATSPAFRRAFAADAQACMDALVELERAADERLGNDAPGFVGARDAVRDMQALVPPPPRTRRRLPPIPPRHWPRVNNRRWRPCTAARPVVRRAPSTRASRPSPSCARSPNSSAARSRTAPCPTMPRRLPRRASRTCTRGCAPWSRIRLRWHTSRNCWACSRRRTDTAAAGRRPQAH